MACATVGTTTPCVAVTDAMCGTAAVATHDATMSTHTAVLCEQGTSPAPHAVSVATGGDGVDLCTVSTGTGTAVNTADAMMGTITEQHTQGTSTVGVAQCHVGTQSCGGSDDDTSSTSSSYEDDAFDSDDEGAQSSTAAVSDAGPQEQISVASSSHDTSHHTPMPDTPSSDPHNIVSVASTSYDGYSNFDDEDLHAPAVEQPQADTLAAKYEVQLAQIRKLGVSASDEEVLQMLDEVDGDVQIVTCNFLELE
eukprot:TRINITY_DN16029_c0_g1_i2.p2 TRINITY_DN16029_c0_g1~~TRINITY_DN16029_c0_g1_i2.p2  ORF type:complete len:272 (+),score=102.84 TRINITY_DN16029_c0_g1_i2:63-818(+)